MSWIIPGRQVLRLTTSPTLKGVHGLRGHGPGGTTTALTLQQLDDLHASSRGLGAGSQAGSQAGSRRGSGATDISSVVGSSVMGGVAGLGLEDVREGEAVE